MRQRRPLLPIVIGLFILMAIGLLPVSLPLGDDTNTQQAAQGGAVNTVPDRPIGGIFAGITAVQEFPVAGTRISAVGLVLATYQRTNSGTLHVELQTQTNGKWHTLGSQTVDETTLQDDALNTVPFDPPVAVKPGDTARIVVRADGNAQNAISWWINPVDQRPGFALFYRGDPLPGVAEFRISYMRGSGRVITMIGPLWGRITLFLDPLWRVILAVGICTLLGSLFVLGRYLPGTAPAFSHEPSSKLLDAVEEAFSSRGFSAREEGEGLEEGRQNVEQLLPDPANEGVDR